MPAFICVCVLCLCQNEELEEKLNDAVHQKQLLALRLDSQLKLAQEENRWGKMCSRM